MKIAELACRMKSTLVWALLAFAPFYVSQQANAFEVVATPPVEGQLNHATEQGPRTHHVAPAGNGDHTRIQDAITAAKSGDEVLVAPGVYQENINFLGKNIRISSHFRNNSDRTFITNTVIDGGANGLSVVVFESGESPDAVLDGFTIRNGIVAGSGGGVRISVASATVRNCRILENRANGGGGIDVYYATQTPIIEKCWLEGNVAGAGGGIYTFASNLRVEECGFLDNQAGEDGSAIFWYGRGGIRMRHCLFARNSGGKSVISVPGIESGGQSFILNCTLFENVFADASIRSLGTCFLVNNILQDAGLQFANGGIAFFESNVVRGGRQAIASALDRTVHYSASNIDSLVHWNSDETRLGFPAVHSPTLGSGTSRTNLPGALIEITGMDLYGRGVPSPEGSRLDIGAVELPFGGPLSTLETRKLSCQVGLGFTNQIRIIGDGVLTSLSELPIGVSLVTTGVPPILYGLPRKAGDYRLSLVVSNAFGWSTNHLDLAIRKGTPAVTWDPPSVLPYGSTLDTDFFSSSASVAGSFRFSPTLGTIINTLTTQDVTVEFQPDDVANYDPVVLTKQVAVERAQQTISFDFGGLIIAGETTPLIGQSTSGLPLLFEVISGPGFVDGTNLHAAGGGEIVVRVTQSGDFRFHAASPQTRVGDALLRLSVGDHPGGVVLREPAVGELVRLGQLVTLTAAPKDGYLFQGWSGLGNVSGNPLQIQVTTNLNISALFSQKWVLTVSNNEGGIVLSEPIPSAVVNGGRVTLTAIPDPGFGFRSWQGNLTNSSNPLDIVLSTNLDIIAVFGKIVHVQIQDSVGGRVRISSDSDVYIQGNQIRLFAESDDGYRFIGWKGPIAGLANGGELTLAEDLLIAPNFLKLQRTDISISGSGEVAVEGGPYHALAEEFNITAHPSTGWAFERWSGSLSSTNNPLLVRQDENVAITAVFKRLYTLTVDSGGGGTIDIEPSLNFYVDGSVVNLLARPAQHYKFSGWSGGHFGNAEAISVTITNNLVLRGDFAPNHWLAPSSTQRIATGFRLIGGGTDGLPYLIEASSGLVGWTPIGTVTNRNGQFEFLDQSAASISRRFYRLRPALP